MNLEGKWEGFYEYGNGYTLPQFGKRVKIWVNLKGENEDFTGEVSEEKSEYSIPYKGIIKGFWDEGLISFVWTYPVNPRFKEQGSTEIMYPPGKPRIAELKIPF